MQPSTALYELVYTSTISPDEEPGVVAKIATDSRTANVVLNITGLLVFDGHRFAQHLEGSMEAVLDLYARIEADIRHGNIHLLHQGTSEQQRYARFSMGFADVVDTDALWELEQLSGQPALQAFAAIYENVELYC